LKRGSDRGGHVLKLPADLAAYRIWSVSSAEACRHGGMSSRTKSMRSHMSNGCGLPGCSGGADGRMRPHVTGGITAPEPMPDRVGNIQLTTREGPRASDCGTRTAVLRGLRLKQPQHALGAVRCPRRNELSVNQAQRLRRRHRRKMSAGSLRLPDPPEEKSSP
jgi:hypothetical protein